MNLTGRQSACFIALIAVLFLGFECIDARAQNVPTAASAGSAGGATSSSKGLAQVISGVKSYRSGKMGPAIATLTKALTSGGLSSKDLAKALYYRGLAFRRSKKPAEAIADLTSAMWLKGGLSEKERQDAIKNRSSAYKEAGIQDTGLVVARSSGAPPSAPAAAPVAAGGGWQVATKSSQGSSKARAAVKPVINPGLTSGPGTLQVAPVGGNSTTASPGSSGSSTNTFGSETIASVGSFFGNMFGGGSSSNSATGNGVATGTIAPSATAPAGNTGSTGGPVSAVSGWNSQTQLSTATASKKTAALSAAVKPKALPKPKAKPLSGKYRIRVAAVRSQEEASKVVSLFQQKFASALGGRKAEITPEVIGNMGTFYNVQFGPFARAQDYKTLCTAARSNGYDCLVLKK